MGHIKRVNGIYFSYLIERYHVSANKVLKSIKWCLKSIKKKKLQKKKKALLINNWKICKKIGHIYITDYSKPQGAGETHEA